MLLKLNSLERDFHNVWGHCWIMDGLKKRCQLYPHPQNIACFGAIMVPRFNKTMSFSPDLFLVLTQQDSQHIYVGWRTTGKQPRFGHVYQKISKDSELFLILLASWDSQTVLKGDAHLDSGCTNRWQVTHPLPKARLGGSSANGNFKLCERHNHELHWHMFLRLNALFLAVFMQYHAMLIMEDPTKSLRNNTKHATESLNIRICLREPIMEPVGILRDTTGSW